MSTNKISKVQLNNEQYSLKGDASNIKDVMLPTVDDIYSKITTGTDSATILLILENISGLLNGKADKSQIDSIWSLIEALNNRIPNSTINYYFAYKVGSQTPQRPGNDETYVPYGWTGYPIIPNTDEVLYMTMARKANDEWFNWENNTYRWTQPIAFGSSKSSQSVNIEGSIALYKLSQGTPTLSSDERRTKAYPSGWSTTPDFASLGNKEIYMITAKTLNGDLVLVNGYYWSVPMRIGNGTTSGTGADGLGYNYIYALKPSSSSFSAPSFTVQQIEESSTHSITENGTTWYDRPLGVSETNKYEYISVSVGSDDNGWSAWSPPVLWSKWGERGMDGDTVEYIYKRTSSEQNLTLNLPYSGSVGNTHYTNVTTSSDAYKMDDFIPDGWTDNPSGVDDNNLCEYVAIRKKKDEVWQPFEQPVLWAKYGKQGPPGVVNGYLITCDNSSVIADNDLFTKSNALSRFNALASATFTLIKTSGESITPTYEVDSQNTNLPAGISPASTFANTGILTYTGSFTNASNIQDGDVYYVTVNGKVGGLVVASIKQTIYVKDFSLGESYKLLVSPTSIEVSYLNKFTKAEALLVRFVVIDDIPIVPSDTTGFVDYGLSYDVKGYESSLYIARQQLSVDFTLGALGSNAESKYIIELYKSINSTRVLVDIQTVSIYKNGEKGDLGIKGSVLRYRGIWNDLVTNNTSTLTFECNTPEGANITYIDVVSKQIEGGLKYYQCLLQHSLQQGYTTPNLDNSQYWQEAQQFDFIITKTLISDYISATTISADDVVITEKNDQGVITDIVAGMTSSHSDRNELDGATVGDVRIWAGTTGTLNVNIQNAPFLVTLDGRMISTNAYVHGLGMFDGEVTARSLNINTPDGKTAMQFRILDTNITVDDKTYLAGTPVIMAFKDDLTYILDMTNITYNPDNVTYTSFSTRTPTYPLNYSNIEEFVQALIACNEVTGGYSSVPDTARLNYVAAENTLYLAQSAKLSTKVTIRIDGNLVPFTGWTVNYGIISSSAVINGQLRIIHKYVYKIEVYNDGTVIQTDTTSGLVGTVILDTQGNIIESDLVDQPVNTIFTANAPVFAVMPKPNYNFASTKEYQTDFSPYPGNVSPIE